MATIDLIVLGILKKEPMGAYDIQKLVEYRNISKWVKISTPSIYKKAIQLEEKGFIKGEIVKEGKMPEKAVYSLTDEGAFTFSIKEFCPSKQIITEILKIGIPTLTFQLLTSLSIAFINREANIYGDAVIAGMGAVTRITSMGTLVVFGFLKGFQPIAGFSYGAKKFDRLREAIKTSILWSTIFCVVVGLTIALFSTQIISQFTEGNTEMISVGQKSLMANGFSFFVFGFYTVYSSLFLALGKGTAGFVLGACRQGICFVPIILLLPSFWGINGILYAQPIADVISAIVTVFMALHLHKELATTKEH